MTTQNNSNCNDNRDDNRDENRDSKGNDNRNATCGGELARGHW